MVICVLQCVFDSNLSNMEVVTFFVPKKFQFSDEQMIKIRQSWLEHWGFLAGTEEEMSDEEILIEAKNLGFVRLPAKWKA